ncbi:MAG: FtsX-like permease family protein [Planctomycetota bacterium]
MIPLDYIVRNIRRRSRRALMTVVGVALVIGIYTVMSAVATTMVSGFRQTGTDDEVIVLQAGALTADFSSVARSAQVYVETREGVASREGVPLVSPEVRLGCTLATEAGGETSVDVRGIQAGRVAAYGQVELTDGAWPRSGFEACIGRPLADQLGVRIGSTLRFERAEWRVVGLMDSGGCVFDQEIWVDMDDLAATAQRRDISGFTLRAVDADHAASIIRAINENPQHALRARSAPAFYARAGASSAAVAGIGSFLALIIAVGAVFGGMNTMFANVAGRRREFGILRAMGYRRWNVLFAVLVESLLICGLGGLVGIALGFGFARIPFELPYLAHVAVRVQPAHVVQSLVLTILIGALGGLLPALLAARQHVVDALQAHPGS